jgi:Tfp pilus assembly protein PilF
MRRRFASFLVAVFLLSGAAAFGSEESERVYSQGLVAFHAHNYAAALTLFEQAARADPEDVYARYYRGVTFGRLGNHTAAVADLRAVLQARPDMDQAALELGVALVQVGSPAEAIPLLERGQRIPEAEAAASLFLGIAHLRLGDRRAARAQWQRALAHDPALAVPVYYYQGIADYQDSNWSGAERHFDAVAAESPDSEMGREAAALLRRLRAGERPATELFAEAGFQYDSNVVLAPTDEAIATAAGITRRADGSAFVSVGGNGVVWRGQRVQLSLGYDFYQSLYFNLTQFDLQDHRPTLQLVGAFGDARAGLLAYYDFYLLDTSRFLSAVTASPWLEVPSGNFGRTQFTFRLRWQDFLQQPFESQNSSIDYAPAIREIFALGAVGRYLLFGYQFDRNDPSHAQGDRYGYDGNEVMTGLGWTFPYGFSSDLFYAYRHEDYDGASNGRVDNEHDITAVVEYPISPHVSGLLGYFGTFNDSNDPDFNYNRNIGSVSLRARF